MSLKDAIKFSRKKPKACYEAVHVQMFLRLFFAPYRGDLSPVPPSSRPQSWTLVVVESSGPYHSDAT